MCWLTDFQSKFSAVRIEFSILAFILHWKMTSLPKQKLARTSLNQLDQAALVALYKKAATWVTVQLELRAASYTTDPHNLCCFISNKVMPTHYPLLYNNPVTIEINDLLCWLGQRGSCLVSLLIVIRTFRLHCDKVGNPPIFYLSCAYKHVCGQCINCGIISRSLPKRQGCIGKADYLGHKLCLCTQKIAACFSCADRNS